MATRSRKRKAALPLGREAREVRVRLGLLALDNIDLPKHTYGATIFMEASWEVLNPQLGTTVIVATILFHHKPGLHYHSQPLPKLHRP